MKPPSSKGASQRSAALLISRTHLEFRLGNKGALASVPLRSERVALFLGALALAHLRRTAVTSEGFARLLVALGAKGAPNRKAMSEIVSSAQLGLDSVLATQRSAQIAWPIRGATVGPWHLADADGLGWSVDPHLLKMLSLGGAVLPASSTGGPSSRGSPTDNSPPAWEQMESLADASASWLSGDAYESMLPAITSDGRTPSLRLALDRLLNADFAFARGDYVPAAEELLALARDAGHFRPEGRAGILLRYVRCAKRLGWHEQATAAIDRTLRIAQQDRCRDSTALVSEALTLRARIAYEQDPIAATQALWGELVMRRGQMPRTSSQRHGRDEFDRSNLLALMARRRAQSLTGQDASVTRKACATAWAVGMESLYWAWADNDTFNLQNGVANTAYMLQCLRAVDARWCEFAIGCTSDEVLNWHTLGFKLCRLFNLGDETAWDRIFVAQLWLSRPIAQWEAPHGGLRDEGIDPTRLAFYQGTVDRAEAVGDRRQVALALQALWRFGRHVGATPTVAKAIHRLQGLPSAVRSQLVADGYALP